MTKKGKSRGKKTNIQSKKLQSPSSQNSSPKSQISHEESEEEQVEKLNNTNASKLQNSPELVQDDEGEQAETNTSVIQAESPIHVAPGEATTSFGSLEQEVDQEQHEHEVGLSEIASFSRKNVVLSP